ncbi:DUF4349 domain-containing protein [Agromyces sp. NPDC058136]|uniref:DUF4349 domain-containing protein n=1 Tax=Agromyces sp. NPDC058136 TaxID=3346354 RepID=UPI0036D98DDF
MRRLVPAAAAAALTALLLAGCSMGSGVESSSHEPPMPADGGTAEEFDQSGATGDGAQSGADDAATQSVITTGRMSITVDDPIATAEDAADLARDAGGRIESRTEQPGTDASAPSAQLVLRVPADELDGVVDGLRELGEVNGIAMEEQDVTAQRKDLDARIEALSASVDRLEQLLAQATTITDLIAIESELTTRQAEFDSLTQQRDWLVDQVDYSTLSVELITVETAPETAPDDFWSGLAAGWAALTVFASALAVALGVLLPWIAVLLVIAAIIVLVVVLATRGRRRAVQAQPTEAKPAEPQPTPTESRPMPPMPPAPSSDEEPRA